MSDFTPGREAIKAARISVIRAAGRRMVDTDEYFYEVLGKWLLRRADRDHLSSDDVDVDAYRIAEAYLESYDRLARWGRP